MIRVLFAGGGTGGHLCPGLALADALRARHPDAALGFLGAHGGLESRLVPRAGYPLDLTAAPRGNPVSLRDPLRLPRFLLALAQSRAILRREQAQAVVALGGYAAAGPGLMARWLGIPLFLLEQNTVPGRVTRLLARNATEIHLQFDEARPYLRHARGTIHHMGSPLRAAVRALAEGDARYEAGVETADPEQADGLLVLGGSQGAEALNEAVLAAAPRLLAETDLRILHVAGARNEGLVRAAYAAQGPAAGRVEVLGFSDDMPSLLRRARIAVSRAGAGAIAELGAAGLPSILVPLPTAKDNHQLHNARAVADRGGAWILEQGDDASATGTALAEMVHGLGLDQERARRLGETLRRETKLDAADRIAEAILARIGATPSS